jgi:putative endonuclease
MCFVYILQSIKSGKFYVGHALDLPKRLNHHNSGYSKSTKSGVPWEIVHTEEYQTRSDAMKREYEIKAMKSRTYILHLIKKN